MRFVGAMRKVLGDLEKIVQNSERCLEGRNCPYPPQGIAPAVHAHYKRYQWNMFEMLGSFVSLLAGTVYLIPFQAEETLTVDRIGGHWRDIVAGNIRVGIYKDNVDTPAGGALVVESASIAIPAGPWTMKEFAIANTQLAAGLYWLAVQVNDTNNVLGGAIQTNTGATVQTCTYAQAFGPFANPCPAVAVSGGVATLYCRIASVP